MCKSYSMRIFPPKNGFRFLFIIFLFLIAFIPNNKAAAWNTETDLVPIDRSITIGQSLVSLHRGLNHIGLFVDAKESTQGNLELKIYKNFLTRELVHQQIFPMQISSYQYFSMRIPPIKDSYLQPYYIELSWDGIEPIYLGIRETNPEDQGSLYLDNNPVLSQLNFDLGYEKFQLVFGILKIIFQWVWNLLLVGLVLLLPGWAAFSILWNRWKSYDFFTKIALSSGFSIAFYPILFLISGFLNVRAGKLGLVFLPLIISAAALIYKNHQAILSFQWNKTAYKDKLFDRFKFACKKYWFVFITVGIIIFVKLWVIRTVETPLWGDSYQHTMITQLILDNDGLFNSWMPYAQYKTLSIHFGFHALSAVYAWIRNANASQAVIWMGQILNILNAFCVYPLVKRLSKDNKWAALIAIVFVAVIFKFPHFFVNWGRYAQLSGQTILSISAFLLLEGLFSKDSGKKDMLIIPVFLGGMALLYFRLPFFFALLWAPLFIFELISWAKSSEFNIGHLLIKASIIVIVTFAIGWMLYARISNGELVESVGGVVNNNIAAGWTTVVGNIKLVRKYYSDIFFILMAVSLVVSGFKKNWSQVMIPIGLLFLHSFFLGTTLNIPFAYYIDGFSILLMSYIPFCILLGYLFGNLFVKIENLNPVIPRLILVIGVVFFAYQAKDVTNKAKYEYVTKADLRAFEWIKLNTQPDNLFLVNGFNIYHDSSSVGSDGGWWIPLLTERQNTMPPQYALLNEKPIEPGYSQLVPEIILWLESHNPDSPEGVAALCNWGVDYIYIGQKQGGCNDTTPLLQWQKWKGSTSLTEVYIEDRVRIYQFDTSKCNAAE